MVKPAFVAAVLLATGFLTGGLAAPARAATLCDVVAPLRIAAMDTREGIYVGSWRDDARRLRSCAALVIERFNSNETVNVVYFYGPEPAWSIDKPGFRRETLKVQGYDTLVTETLTTKVEFKLVGGTIEAKHTDANGKITTGKLQKQY
jgi:hypothetical protein